MRIIRDDVYVFSVARSMSGKILANRAYREDNVIGKDINDVLAFDKADMKYINAPSEAPKCHSICLSCYPNGERRVVAIFDFMYQSSSIGLAVVFHGKPTPVVKALSVLGDGIVELAPSLVDLLDKSDEKFSLEDHNEFTNIAYLYGCVLPLSELQSYRTADSAEFLRRYADLATEFVGTELQYIADSDRTISLFNGEKAVFSGGFCAALLLASAMIARRSSYLARLDVEVLFGLNGVSVRCGFDADCKTELDVIEFLDQVAKSYGIYFDKIIKDGRVWIEVIPLYSDIGLAEVKARDPYPSISEFM